MENVSYYLGIDGGGTKTEFLLFCSDGTQIKRIVLGCSNPNVVGIEKCAQLLKSGIDEMLGVYPQIKAVYIGAAGFLLGNNAETINALVESIKKPKVNTTTPATRQKPLFFTESFRSVTMHTRRTITTTTAVIITPGLSIFSMPPLSGIITY